MTGTKKRNTDVTVVGSNESIFTHRKGLGLQIDTRMIWYARTDAWEVEVRVDISLDKGTGSTIQIDSKDLEELETGEWIDIGGIEVLIEITSSERRLELEVRWRIDGTEYRWNLVRLPNAETQPLRIERVQTTVGGEFEGDMYGPVQKVAPVSP